MNFKLFIPLACFLINEGLTFQVGNNRYRRAEILDPEGYYLLEWEVDWESERITFDITVKTTNWVGLGFSKNGDPYSAVDMVIGGVDRNGQAYFSDRYVVGDSEIPILDDHQDLSLLDAWENETHTFLSFRRAFDTCDDPTDYPITMDKLTLIWVYGRYDNEDGLLPAYSGLYPVYLLDPDYSPQIIRNQIGSPVIVNPNSNIPDDTKVWSVVLKRTLSASNETSYICTIHKAPRLYSIHMFIGLDIHFPTEEDRLHPHHMIMYRCHSPRNIPPTRMFEPHLSNPGETCFISRFPDGVTSTLPLPFCSEIFTGWTIGGKSSFLPDDVGFEFGLNPDEFYMIQLHYENPKMMETSTEVRFDFFYTSVLRPNFGSVIGVMGEVPGLPEYILLPPKTNNHRIFGHCSPGCTERMFPPEGITIEAVLLHTHNAGVGMRLRHFRGDDELPWIMYDDNYDNRFQPARYLREGVEVLPGDQLTVDCHYATYDKTVVGGYAARQEMCLVFLLYYRKIEDYSFCVSGINSEVGRYHFLGIGNVTWQEDVLEWVANTPSKYAGLKVTQISDRFGYWTPEKLKELQEFHEIHPQTGGCHKDFYTRITGRGDSEEMSVSFSPSGVFSAGSVSVDTPDDFTGPVAYPFGATPYYPPARNCSYNDEEFRYY